MVKPITAPNGGHHPDRYAYRDGNEQDGNVKLKGYRESLKDEVLLTIRPGDYATRLNNLAYSRFKTGDTANVIMGLTTALKITEEANDINEQSYTHYNLAEYKLSLNDTIQAFDHALKAVELGKRS